MAIEIRPEFSDWWEMTRDWLRDEPEGEGKIVNADSPLRLREIKSHVPTVELDLDSLWHAGYDAGWGFLSEPLGEYAERNRKCVATVYVHEVLSVNWQYLHNAVFFGVAGNKKKAIRNTIVSALREKGGMRSVEETDSSYIRELEKWNVRVDHSADFMARGQGEAVRHIEKGKVWRPYQSDLGASVWCTDI